MNPTSVAALGTVTPVKAFSVITNYLLSLTSFYLCCKRSNKPLVLLFYTARSRSPHLFPSCSVSTLLCSRHRAFSTRPAILFFSSPLPVAICGEASSHPLSAPRSDSRSRLAPAVPLPDPRRPTDKGLLLGSSEQYRADRGPARPTEHTTHVGAFWQPLL